MTAWTAATAEVRDLDQLEGTDITGSVRVKILARTPHQLVMEVLMSAGARSSPHAHACDSTGVMLEGRARAVVDGKVVEVGPGDGYHHPEGVEHHVEALTSCRFIEIKSPPVEPW
jgi:quercetin dioxygenase-like cupin family protein